MSGPGVEPPDGSPETGVDRIALPPAPIARLAPEVASQLAAGEVVERPASVIKELLENSLDAGARSVTIELEAGGVRALRVADDGGGIRREDLALARERHATSKIESVEDLFRVASLGFRGEALASIAAVSRLSITTRAGGEESGWRIRGDGDVPEPVRHPFGTTVEIRDLFYNVPARRRFLRAERTELQHAVETVRRLALARPDVSFSLRHEGRIVFRTRLGAERADEVVGRGFTATAAPVDAAADGMHLRGWIGPGSSSRQYFFLNGRAVRDRALGHAVRIALEGRFPAGHEAVCILFLAMDPAQVDVNVHPGKHEVRFRQPRAVHDFLVIAIRRALGGGLAGLGVREPEAPPYHGSAPREPWYGLFGAGAGAGGRPPGEPEKEGSSQEPPGEPGGAPTGDATEGAREAAGRPGGRFNAARRSRPASRPPAPGRAAGGLPRPEPPVLGWIADRYAVASVAGRVLVIDVLRALELAVRAACAGASETRPMPSLPLLVPARVKVAATVLDGFESSSVGRYGIVLRRVGPDLASLLEIPRELRYCDPAALARSVIEAGEGAVAAALGRAASSAVPADPAERDVLLRELLARPEAVLAPAVARELDERAVAGLFSR